MRIENKEIRCALIFLGPFPIGNVSSIRIMSYCKALVKRGVSVTVLLIAPTAEAACNENSEGEVDGVLYKYMTKVTWDRSNTPYLIKLLYYLIGLLKSISFVQKSRVNCLLSYHDEFFSNVFFKCLTKLLSIPYIIDKTEYPQGYFNKSTLGKRIVHLRMKLFDGYIVITKELKDFYLQITQKKSTHFFLLPMTMDMDRFKNVRKQMADESYITVVFGTHNRDGLFDSVISYYKYCKLVENKPFKLILIGDYEGLCKSFPECLEIKKYIVENNIQSNVEFKGLIQIDNVPQILLNSECLLTTPIKYVSGGFPTKLGEYLLSGVPVVATAAGEISNYLTHKKNILLSPPSDLDDVARNILYVHQNKMEAKEIAESAKIVVREIFNAESYSAELIKFLKSLVKG